MDPHSRHARPAPSADLDGVVRPDPPRRWALWTSFLAAPLVWMAHFLLAYLLVEAGCTGGPGRAGAFRTALIVVTVAAVLGCAAAAAWASVVARRAARSREAWDDLLPRVGALGAPLFILVLLVEGAMLLTLELCR